MCFKIKKNRLTKDAIQNMTISEYMCSANIPKKECFDRIRNFNRYWNKHLIRSSCIVCHYSSHVELAHIKPIKDFDLQSKIGDVNDEANIIALCPNHHWEFDNGRLSIEEILGFK